MQAINKEENRVRIWLHILGLALLCAALMMAAWQKSGQISYPYPLDDSYIHLSIAESWVDHGIPSPEASQPAFSSSSPLYSSLLALLIFLTGPWIYWPLLIGMFAGIGFTWTLYREFQKNALPYSNGWLWTIIVLGPVPLLMLLGMEHILQVWIWTLFFFQVRQIVSGGNISTRRVLVLSFLVVSIRYEGLFLIAATSLVLFIATHRKQAFLAGSGGLLAIVVPGLLSTLNGGTFFPLSLLMKGHLPGFDLMAWGRFVQEVLTRLYEHPFMFAVLFISAVGWAASSLFEKHQRQLSAMLQLASWAHVIFAEIGGYRYEAWIIVLHLILLAYLAAPYFHSINRWHVLASGWLVLPLLIRTLFFSVNYPVSVQNIYDQSIQVGTFIKDHLQGEAIAVQDIGAASYLSDFRLTDLAGIGDQEINSLFRDRQFGPETVREILEYREVSYAIIQQAWMGWVIPEDWIVVGCWTTPEAFIVPNAEVFFWAADSVSAENLTEALKAYRPSLPDRVQESGPYVGRVLPVVIPLP